MFIPDPDPTIFWYPGSDLFYPGSRIRILQREGKTFFMHEKVKIEVIF
jgi:hypothetical protein